MFVKINIKHKNISYTYSNIIYISMHIHMKTNKQTPSFFPLEIDAKSYCQFDHCQSKNPNQYLRKIINSLNQLRNQIKQFQRPFTQQQLQSQYKIYILYMNSLKNLLKNEALPKINHNISKRGYQKRLYWKSPLNNCQIAVSSIGVEILCVAYNLLAIKLSLLSLVDVQHQKQIVCGFKTLFDEIIDSKKCQKLVSMCIQLSDQYLQALNHQFDIYQLFQQIHKISQNDYTSKTLLKQSKILMQIHNKHQRFIQIISENKNLPSYFKQKYVKGIQSEKLRIQIWIFYRMAQYLQKYKFKSDDSNWQIYLYRSCYECCEQFVHNKKQCEQIVNVKRICQQKFDKYSVNLNYPLLKSREEQLQKIFKYIQKQQYAQDKPNNSSTHNNPQYLYPQFNNKSQHIEYSEQQTIKYNIKQIKHLISKQLKDETKKVRKMVLIKLKKLKDNTSEDMSKIQNQFIFVQKLYESNVLKQQLECLYQTIKYNQIGQILNIIGDNSKKYYQQLQCILEYLNNNLQIYTQMKHIQSSIVEIQSRNSQNRRNRSYTMNIHTNKPDINIHAEKPDIKRIINGLPEFKSFYRDFKQK